MYRTICWQYLIENDFCLKFDFIQKTWNIMHILNGEIFMELIIRGNLFDFFSKKKKHNNQPYVILIKCIEIEWSISLKGSHLLLACKKALIGLIIARNQQVLGNWLLYRMNRRCFRIPNESDLNVYSFRMIQYLCNS